MKYILNSAVITKPGTYVYRLISLSEAKEWLAPKDWVSTIGYPQTAEALEMLTGIKVDVNRKQVEFGEGDEGLVFRLTIRLNDPQQKGKLSLAEILKNHEIGILRREK